MKLLVMARPRPVPPSVFWWAWIWVKGRSTVPAMPKVAVMGTTEIELEEIE